VESPLIVREQLGLLFIIRAFHLSVGKPYWYCSVYYFLSAKKKNYAVIRIEKLQGPLCIISRKMFLIHSQHLTFDPLRSYLTLCEKTLASRSSRKPLTLHAWKFIYDQTWISWGYCAFVLRVSMILIRVIALETL
jgi:hypothetical protein